MSLPPSQHHHCFQAAKLAKPQLDPFAQIFHQLLVTNSKHTQRNPHRQSQSDIRLVICQLIVLIGRFNDGPKVF
jgi:hypothetical protein